MKYIYVTMMEFMENGGVLKKGRELFDVEGETAGVIMDHGSMLLEVHCDVPRPITIGDRFHMFVKIEVMPIWK